MLSVLFYGVQIYPDGRKEAQEEKGISRRRNHMNVR
jgi:hypothetical protein